METLVPGEGWIQVSVLGQRASQVFGPDGSRRDFLADSRFDTRSLYITGAYGLAEGLEIWAQTPVHNLKVRSAGGDTESEGLGDIRLAARIGPELLGLDLPLTARFGTKIPGSTFPVDATILPLTEGQLDWEAALESAYQLPDRPFYVRGSLGYRWRQKNAEAARDPGDEIFGGIAMGGTMGAFHWEISADGLRGRPPVAQGFTLEGDARRMIQLLPTLGFEAGPGRVEGTAQIPLWGKNLPAGLGIGVGYRMASGR